MVCEKCGHPNEDDALFCSFCGEELPSKTTARSTKLRPSRLDERIRKNRPAPSARTRRPTEAPGNQSQTSSRKTASTWITILFLVGIVVVIFLIYDPSSDTETIEQTTRTSQISSPQSQQSQQTTLRNASSFGDGSHEVGVHIKSGTYRSSGSGSCYWARLSDFSHGVGSIIANGISSPAIVTIGSSDAGFETRGCGNWVQVRKTVPTKPQTTFTDGTYQVGVHIAPGTYRSSGSGYCYWARLSNFGHDLGGIIANGINAPETVTISNSDAGFETRDCGSWTKRR